MFGKHRGGAQQVITTEGHTTLKRHQLSVQVPYCWISYSESTQVKELQESLQAGLEVSCLNLWSQHSVTLPMV